jgi:hypothetical protein
LWGGTPLSFLFCRDIRQLLQVIALSDGDCPQVFNCLITLTFLYADIADTTPQNLARRLSARRGKENSN